MFEQPRNKEEARRILTWFKKADCHGFDRKVIRALNFLTKEEAQKYLNNLEAS